jgi:hypothetical protein
MSAPTFIRFCFSFALLFRLSAGDLRLGYILQTEHLAATARNTKPDFLIVPQNAAQLLENNVYLNLISAIGIEDLFTDDNRIQKENESAYRIEFLKRLDDSQKPVFLIEYPKSFNTQHHAATQTALHNWNLLLTSRELTGLGWNILPPDGIEVSDYVEDAPRQDILIDNNHSFANGLENWGGGISILTRNPKSGPVRIGIHISGFGVGSLIIRKLHLQKRQIALTPNSTPVGYHQREQAAVKRRFVGIGFALIPDKTPNG